MNGDALSAWMELALEEARAAEAHGDVPIGAVLVDDAGGVLARGHNQRERDHDPTGHAEIITLRRAAEQRGSWRLLGTTMVVTLEPCLMCAGALLGARVERVVYGCRDPKAGALDSLFVVGRDPRLTHRFDVVAGVQAAEASALLKRFFEERRHGSRSAMKMES